MKLVSNNILFCLTILLNFDVHAQVSRITEQCIGCLCYAFTQCEPNFGCEGEVCGPFRISILYWTEVGKPLTDNIKSSKNETQNFLRCAISTECSSNVVKKYMNKFPIDCNNDGKVDCDDFLHVHFFGGHGCVGKTLPKDNFVTNYNICKKKLGGITHFNLPNV